MIQISSLSTRRSTSTSKRLNLTGPAPVFTLLFPPFSHLSNVLPQTDGSLLSFLPAITVWLRPNFQFHIERSALLPQSLYWPQSLSQLPHMHTSIFCFIVNYLCQTSSSLSSTCHLLSFPHSFSSMFFSLGPWFLVPCSFSIPLFYLSPSIWNLMGSSKSSLIFVFCIPASDN